MKAASRLVMALAEAKAPEALIERARKGYYGDFTSPLTFPISALVAELQQLGLNDLARRAMHGDFDGE